jgi:hypothetical protein
MARCHLIALSLALAACASPEAADDESSVTQRTWSGSVLYARDGSVVSPTPGGERGAALPAHEVRPSEGGRMYILELYQKAIEERDALAAEVGALGAELEKTRKALADSGEALARAEGKALELQTREQALLEENMELAARLTTAQIRRLQAEKLLLETKIALTGTARASAPVEAGQASRDK